jgi:tRNA (cmo5U34)-methyltransferase
MQNQKAPVVFDKERASSYDQQYAKLAPLRDAIHLLIRLLLSDLPADARVLCVGVGTGSELIDRARAFPQWQLTAVEPAAPMLDICRQRAQETGITPRCTFHQGHIDSLPASDAFDAATCLLVSHFLLTQEEQRGLFTRIAARLRPEGYLVSSALASDTATAAYQSLLEVWMRMQSYTGVPAETVAKIPSVFGRDVAVLPPAQIESIIASGGFSTPVRFYQTLLIHAWYAKRTPGTAPDLS